MKILSEEEEESNENYNVSTLKGSGNEFLNIRILHFNIVLVSLTMKNTWQNNVVIITYII